MLMQNEAIVGRGAESVRMTQAPLVLVLEDDAPVRTLMACALQAAGYRAMTASTAIEAVGLVRREHPDLILSDLLLPGPDGAVASLSIKDKPGMETVPVILVSGLPEIAERAAETGAADFLSKPFRPGELLQRVRRVLGLPAKGWEL